MTEDLRRKQQEAHKHDFAVWNDARPAEVARSMGPVNVEHRPVELGRRVILDALDDCETWHITDFHSNAEQFARALLKRLNIPVKA